jgi:uncharacterized protein YhdP
MSVRTRSAHAFGARFENLDDVGARERGGRLSNVDGDELAGQTVAYEDDPSIS